MRDRSAAWSSRLDRRYHAVRLNCQMTGPHAADAEGREDPPGQLAALCSSAVVFRGKVNPDAGVN